MTQEEQANERNNLITETAEALAYVEVRIFYKEILIKSLKTEVESLRELDKLQVLYTQRNRAKKVLEDL